MADDGVSNFYDTELFQACIYPKQKSNACVQMVKKYFNVVAVKTESREYYIGVIQTKYIDGKTVFLGKDKSKRSFNWSWALGRSDYSDRFILSDGSEFTFGAVDNYGRFDIDTNGEKGPNTEGIDIFEVTVGEGGRLNDWWGLITIIQENNWKFPW